MPIPVVRSIQSDRKGTTLNPPSPPGRRVVKSARKQPFGYTRWAADLNLRPGLPAKPTVPLQHGLRARIVSGVMSLIEQLFISLRQTDITPITS